MRFITLSVSSSETSKSATEVFQSHLATAVSSEMLTADTLHIQCARNFLSSRGRYVDLGLSFDVASTTEQQMMVFQHHSKRCYSRRCFGWPFYPNISSHSAGLLSLLSRWASHNISADLGSWQCFRDKSTLANCDSSCGTTCHGSAGPLRC